MLSDLNERSRIIFRDLVDTYMRTGLPVGSKLLAERTNVSLSPASIRSVLADLETRGLLASPHTSAGRIPTEAGLRLFVDGLMEVGDLSEDDRSDLEARCVAAGRSVEAVLSEATAALSGLSACAGLVVAPKLDRPVRQIDFVRIDQRRVLVILVSIDGMVENRVVEMQSDVAAGNLIEASNYLNSRLHGRSLLEVQREIEAERKAAKDQLDSLAQQVVDSGLAVWSGSQSDTRSLIVRGQAHLLADIQAVGDLERLRMLFEALESHETVLRLLKATGGADGVRIFIGSDTTLFDHSGCSVIVSPYKDRNGEVIGAIGVIGPTRLPYARVIPMVDFTAQMVGRIIT